ncbi:MAG: hypothetical protein RIE08_17155 [Acidimicrobiales bacterium]
MIQAHDPRAEAQSLLGDGYLAHVLEPSPPPVGAPDFADDPAVPVDRTRPTVTPTTAGTTTWDDLARADTAIAHFARARWLGAWAPLREPPAGLVAAREDLHRVAYSLVAEARRVSTGKFGLRFTRGGFGTPFFDDDRQVRVEDGRLVLQSAGAVASTELTTLNAAAAHLDLAPGTDAAEHDSPDQGDLDRPLAITPEGADFVADWFGFATSVLEEMRLTGGALDVSRVQLWPGHFDVAIEIGDGDSGRRATYGASPGDTAHDAPYLYIAPWASVPDDAFWDSNAFTGAELGYADILDADDQRGRALGFFREGHRILTD